MIKELKNRSRIKKTLYFIVIYLIIIYSVYYLSISIFWNYTAVILISFLNFPNDNFFKLVKNQWLDLILNPCLSKGDCWFGVDFRIWFWINCGLEKLDKNWWIYPSVWRVNTLFPGSLFLKNDRYFPEEVWKSFCSLVCLSLRFD